MGTAVLAGVIFALLGGCAAQDEADAQEAATRLAREEGPALLYLGGSFDELPLTHVEEKGLLVYGHCEGEGRGDSFHCTAPQVQLQHWPLARRHPGMFMLTPSEAAPCSRGRIGGRQVAAFVTSGGLEVYAGDRVVVIFGDSPARTLRAARALRPLRGEAGSAPPRSVMQALARCQLGLETALRGG